jgi:sulfatase modifying factor 1
MSDFDPYHQWLGIPETERPISKYRLLALVDFELDRGVISAAAERQTIYLRTLQAGEHAVLVAQLLNKISQARVTLLNADQKAAYDEELRKQQAPEPVPEPAPVPIPVVQTPAPTPVVVRGTVTQEFPVSVVQPAKKPRRRKQQKIWKRPAVIGISLVGVIGVLALLMSLMSSGDAELVVQNIPRVVTSPLIPSPQPAAALATANTLRASLQEGLVAYYPFNGNAQDESGNGHHGRVFGAQLATDRFDNLQSAYHFNGLDSYVRVEDTITLRLSEAGYTLSLWCNLEEPRNRVLEALVFKRTRGSQSGYAFGLAGVESEENGDLPPGVLRIMHSGGGDSECHTLSKVPNSQWVNVALAFESETGVVRMFLNGGELLNDGVRCTTPNPKTNAPLFFGYDSSGNPYWYHGQLDDIRIYNRALSEAEVKALYEYESKPPASPIPTAPARESITNTIGMKFKLIPAGTFTMGSPEGEEGRRDNETQHKVTITKAFYMQTTEVTQGQWMAVMGTEPWKGENFVQEGPGYAASWLNWDDAVAYCKKLSEIEDKTYRLPTEAEWEYACRAGTKTTWSFGDDEASLGDYAWYDSNAGDRGDKYAHKVGLKKPNAFGLYDMHGNVWEWVYDYFGEDYYKQSPEQEPQGPARGSSRVLRGGSWNHSTRYSRSAGRGWAGAVVRDRNGFRLVRELD